MILHQFNGKKGVYFIGNQLFPHQSCYHLLSVNMPNMLKALNVNADEK